MRFLTLILLFMFSLSVCATAQTSTDKGAYFDYIDVRGNNVLTTHAAKYELTLDESFRYLGELHHQPIYNDVSFNVSMAVFSRDDSLLMVHAETHTDGSGGLDYSDLESAKLSGLPFTHRTQCASEEDKAELDDNPQIRFVRSKGFDLSIPFQLEQFFTTSKAGDAEVVISFGKAVQGCETAASALASRLSSDLGSLVKIRQVD